MSRATAMTPLPDQRNGGFRATDWFARPAPAAAKPLVLRAPMWGVASGDAGLRPLIVENVVALCTTEVIARRAAEAVAGRVILLATAVMLRAYLAAVGDWPARVIVDAYPGGPHRERWLPPRLDRIMTLAAAQAAVDRGAAEEADAGKPSEPPGEKKRRKTP